MVRIGKLPSVTRIGCIAVHGEALVDFVPDGRGLRRAVPGGSGLNTALALARLGAPVAFCGSLSMDAEGEGLAQTLAREGVDISPSRRSARPCPHVIVSPRRDGSPDYDLHLAGSALEDAPAALAAPSDVAHLHATSFAATTGVGGDAALDAMARARGGASTSFDPNVRLAVLPPLPQARALIAARIAQADIVKASMEDLALLSDDPDGLLGDWRALGPKMIVVTAGAQGARALLGAEEIAATSPMVAVCDTVGAGDVFMAALLAAMHDDGALGVAAKPWTADAAGRWLEFAARAAALCCARPGCDPPRRSEMEAKR